MYAITILENKKILQVLQPCTNKFLVKGKFVKIPKSGIVVFDKNTKIVVGKILHHEFHKIQMAKNRQLLYHNSTICQYKLGKKLVLAENQILLASIEVVEIL